MDIKNTQTAETDHLENELGTAAEMSHPILWAHTRKLERERDEARKEAEYYKERYEQLKDERDEARNKMADALQEVDLRTLDYDRMNQERYEARKERDEAREEIKILKKCIEYDNNKINKLEEKINELRTKND